MVFSQVGKQRFFVGGVNTALCRGHVTPPTIVHLLKQEEEPRTTAVAINDCAQIVNVTDGHRTFDR